jgi:integrase
MAVRKRGNTWQIDYTDPSGKRVRKSFKKKKDADLEHGKRISLIGENRYMDVKPECKTTLNELLKQYEANYQHQRSFKSGKSYYLKNFREYFKGETILANIRYADIETYRNHLRQKITVQNGIRKDASTNREFSCLHQIFRKAVEWEMIDKSPFDRGKSLRIKENNKRTRYLGEDEIPRLLAACAPHLRDIVICALNTGMRRGEILNLKWDQIKDDVIYLQETKTDEPRQIPVNDTLAELLKNIRKEQKFRSEYVFTFTRNMKQGKGPPLVLVIPEQGNRINTLKSSFPSALRRAKIKDFHFHDLRHTFASHLIMKGGTLKEVQELLGHKSMTMTLRYAHLSQDHKKKAVNLLNGLTGSKTAAETMSQNVTNQDLDPSLEVGQSSNQLH